MRTLCLLLLSCLGCFGQAFSFSDPTVASWGGAPVAGGGGGPFTPTNGYPNYSWMLGSDYSAGSWPDRGTNGLTYAKNNATAYPATTGTLDGHQTVIFNGSTEGLSATGYSLANPHELVVLCKLITTRVGAMFDSTSVSFCRGYFDDPDIRMWQGGSDAYPQLNGTSILPAANTWYLFRWVFNGASSVCWSNLAKSENTALTSATQTGFSVGWSAINGANYNHCEIAEIQAYKGVLSDSDYTNIYNYFVTNYPSANLPNPNAAPDTNSFQIQITTTTSPQTFGVSMDAATAFRIAWGDGTTNLYTSAGLTNITHSYANAGTYTNTMTGDTPHFNFSLASPTLLTAILTPIRGITGLSSMNNSFRDTQISTIPSGLFDRCNAVTIFAGVFSGCTNLTAIPNDLFRYNTNATIFDQAFYGTLNYGTKLTYFPTNIFQYNTQAVSFAGLFYKNGGITNVIPVELFASNTLAQDFSYVFANTVSMPAIIPEDLFKNNLLATNFTYTFHGLNASLGNIPTNLFKYNSAAVTFDHAFTSSAFTNIPAGLFDYNTNALSFASTFEGTSITNIPTGLFYSNSAAVTFNSTFGACPYLKTIPANLFVNNSAVTNYTQCFYNDNAATSASPTGPGGAKLWLLSGPPLGDKCFYNDTSMSDYATIDAAWKNGP